jgi:hypothetical protein
MDSDEQNNDFSSFVKQFTRASGFERLPTRLTRVELPDMSAADPFEMFEATKELFKKLHEDFKVTKIVRLFAKDSHNSWISDDLITSWVEKFQVEVLDWRKYDFDIHPLAKMLSENPKVNLRSISLYTTGHEGVLYHWTSSCGLPSMKQVCGFITQNIGRIEANFAELEDVSITLVETSVSVEVLRIQTGPQGLTIRSSHRKLKITPV